MFLPPRGFLTQLTFHKQRHPRSFKPNALVTAQTTRWSSVSFVNFTFILFLGQRQILNVCCCCFSSSADAAEILGQDPTLLNRLVQWCDVSDDSDVSGEANRLLASILRHNRSQVRELLVSYVSTLSFLNFLQLAHIASGNIIKNIEIFFVKNSSSQHQYQLEREEQKKQCTAQSEITQTSNVVLTVTC